VPPSNILTANISFSGVDAKDCKQKPSPYVATARENKIKILFIRF
jgi:hypothetical protein